MGITDADAAATPLGQRLHAEKRPINSYDAYRMDVLRREAIMARYAKMLKVGLPEQVVRQRMQEAGMSVADTGAFFRSGEGYKQH